MDSVEGDLNERGLSVEQGRMIVGNKYEWRSMGGA